MLASLLLLAVYALVGAAAVGAARWLTRPIPLQYALTIWLLPIVFAFPAFFADRTILPVDHAMLSPPWSALGPVAPHNPNLSDAATQMAPWAKAVRVAWKEGSLPLRQRWNGCGMSLAANAQSAAFSPLALLMLALPLARAFTLAVAVKLFLAMLGMWLWLSESRVSRGAALFGAVCFGLSGAMTPWALFPHASVICLWPWALFAIALLEENSVRWRASAALTAIFLLWVLAGHPESVVLGAVFCGMWVLARALSGDLPEPSRVLRRAALCGVAAIGLSAFVLLPETFAIIASNRVPLAEDFAARLPFRLTPHGPFWRNGLATVFFPRALGDAMRSPMIEGGAGSFPEMALGYFGIAGWTLALAILRPGSRRKRAELALLAPFLVGLAAAVGLWPINEVVLVLPVLRMMLPLRYFTWVALAGSAMAAFELDRLGLDLSARRKNTVVVLAVPACLALYALAVWSRFRALHAAAGGLDSQRQAFTVALICLAGTAGAFLVALTKPAPRVIAVVSVCLATIAATELLYQGMRLYRFGSPQDLYPDTPMLAFLHSRPGPFRILGEGAVLFPNSNIFAGLEDVRTHDPVERRDYVMFLKSCCGYNPGDYFKHIENVNSPALDMLNVKYLVSVPGRAAPGPRWKGVYFGGDGTVFENESAVARVFEAGRLAPESAQSGRAAISDYRETTNAATFRAHIRQGKGDVLLVASLVNDGGWSARDGDGRPLAVHRAGGLFLGFRLGPGDHRIRLRYRPPGFEAGAAISLATLFVVLVGVLRSRRVA